MYMYSCNTVKIPSGSVNIFKCNSYQNVYMLSESCDILFNAYSDIS